MIKAILGFLAIIAVLYSGYSYTKSLDDVQLESLVTIGSKVLAVLAIAMIFVACIIMIF